MNRLFLFLLLFALSACRVDAASADRPLFYQLQLDGHHGWLMGSIHVGDASFYPFPAAIDKALAQATGLVLEANPNDPQLPALFSKYALAKQPLPQALQQKLDAHCKQQKLHCNMELAPWLLSSQIAIGMMANSGYSAQYGIEVQLLQRMSTQPLYELEGMARQLKIFDSLSWQANLAMAEASLEPVDLTELVAAWRQGDSERLQQLLLDEFGDDELMQVLMVDRNQYMAKRLVELLQQHDGLLSAVGAAHLVGDDSMIRLLRQQGVKVTDCWRQRCELSAD